MKSLFSLSTFLFLLIQGCSFIEIEISDEDEVQTQNEAEIEKEAQTFIPVSVKGGLIEMERGDYGDFITPDMVLLGNSTFKMVDSNSREREFHIDYEFFISKHEITFEEYDKFVKETKRVSPSDDGWGRENRPVINISYEDAKEYLDWLSEKSGDIFRLPTEAEWEFASRGGSESRFFFGDSIKDLENYGWFWDISSGLTHEVGKKSPNQFNLYDVSGNVWEWCEDGFTEDIFKIPSDGKPYDKGTQKVVKGGSWNDYGINLRHGNRLGFAPTIKMNDTGFRAVMELR
jgi:formylglycine-generating enzyme required for sulfatase activity